MSLRLYTHRSFVFECGDKSRGQRQLKGRRRLAEIAQGQIEFALQSFVAPLPEDLGLPQRNGPLAVLVPAAQKSLGNQAGPLHS